MLSKKFNIKEREEIIRNLKLAHGEWLDREKYFQEVVDPDLVDFAIYEMEASRLKYIYLLKLLRNERDDSLIMAKNNSE